MRLILLLFLVPGAAQAGGVEELVKDTIRHELERRVPRATTPVVMDAPQKTSPSYNLHWRLSTRVGPFAYRDDNMDDGLDGGVKVRLGSVKQFRLEIRKDFW